MAYLHCHSCDWSQDDFYNKSYNLWTKIKSDFKWLWKPRILEFDDGEVNFSPRLSWNQLFREIIKDIKIYRKTKWKTREQWKVERDTAVCPDCGDRNFDID